MRTRRFLPGLLFLSVACGKGDGDGDGSPTDTGGGDGGSGDAALDAMDMADVGEDPALDSADAADLTPDAPGDESPDARPLECDEFQRPVGGRCISVYNRECMSDEDCRLEWGEQCELRAGETAGTCIYTPFPMIDCPGGPGCESGSGELRAGFAARAITPHGWEQTRDGYLAANGYEFEGDVRDPSTFCDCGRDLICPPGPEYADCVSLGEYTAPDADGTEGDEQMQGAWLAGFDHSRPAQLCPEEMVGPDCGQGSECCASRLAHDDLWARAVVFDQGDARIAVVLVDSVGFFYSDGRAIAERLPASLGVDWLLAAATHVHEAPDTMGQWGPGVVGSDLPDQSGVVEPWMEYLYAQAVDAVTEAVEELEPCDVYVAEANTGVVGFAVHDGRDPVIVNTLVQAVHVVTEGGDPDDPADTIGSLVNWHSHPESLDDRNRFITSDFPHYIRQYMEQGLPEVTRIDGDGSGDPVVVPAIPGLGGVSIYVSGSVGGLLGPGNEEAVARDGSIPPDDTYTRADAIGQRVAETSLLALREGRRRVEDETLRFRTREFLVDVVNSQFHTAIFGLNLFRRPVFNWRGDDGLYGPNFPKITTAVTGIRLGDLTFQSFPGELFSETMTGGYHEGTAAKNPQRGDPDHLECGADLLPITDGSGEAGFPCMIDPRNPNPPDLESAPRDGYLYNELPGTSIFVIGLGNDEMGYLVPPYDYELAEDGPYIIEAPGDHYEETNSVGAQILPQVLDEIEALHRDW